MGALVGGCLTEADHDELRGGDDDERYPSDGPAAVDTAPIKSILRSSCLLGAVPMGAGDGGADRGVGGSAEGIATHAGSRRMFDRRTRPDLLAGSGGQHESTDRPPDPGGEGSQMTLDTAPRHEPERG